MAAAIITPASEDFDSRTSSVYIALPAPSDISSARPSSPASRQAPAGARRKRARNAGSASRRSISRAATSASALATSATPDPLPQRLAQHHDHRQEERYPQSAHDAIDDGLGRQFQEDLLVAQRHPDREARGQPGPHQPEHRVAREHRRVGRGALAAQPPRELLLRPPPQPRLAQPVDEDVVAVALDERVQIEEAADVRREREVEEDVAHSALRQQQAAQRED